MQGKLAIHGGPKAVPDDVGFKTWPEVTAEDKAAVMAALDRGVLHGIYSPEITGLEEDWAKWNGSKYVLAFNTGTAALHGATFAMRIGPGDEVITTAFSFSGTFHPILYQMGIPIFVDIDPRTYNIDPKLIEEKITEQTKAIMPVHIHGLPADMDEIMAIARKHNLMVLEDACQAHGALYKGRKAGTIGDMGAYSLNATKNFSGGEGGMLVTESEELYREARRMRTYGEAILDAPEEIRSYACSTIGYNYRTQEMPAAFARSQLKRLNHYNEIAVRNGEFLTKELGEINGITPPYVPPDRTTIYHKYRIRFDPKALGLTVPNVEFRNRLLKALKAEGVKATLWHTGPMPGFPIFQTHNADNNGTPWNVNPHHKNIVYRAEDYPETINLLETSLVINTELYAIFNQDLAVEQKYVEAFHKIFDNLDELLA